LALVMRLHLVRYFMIAPRRGGSPAPTWGATFILGNGTLRIGMAGKLAALYLGDMGGEGLGLSGLSLAMGLLMLLGQLSRISRDQPDGR
jgi:hypothetical protein